MASFCNSTQYLNYKAVVPEGSSAAVHVGLSSEHQLYYICMKVLTVRITARCVLYYNTSWQGRRCALPLHPSRSWCSVGIEPTSHQKYISPFLCSTEETSLLYLVKDFPFACYLYSLPEGAVSRCSFLKISLTGWQAPNVWWAQLFD